LSSAIAPPYTLLPDDERIVVGKEGSGLVEYDADAVAHERGVTHTMDVTLRELGHELTPVDDPCMIPI